MASRQGGLGIRGLGYEDEGAGSGSIAVGMGWDGMGWDGMSERWAETAG